MPKRNRQRFSKPTPKGLELDDIGVIFDQHDPVRVASYMFADGTTIKLDNSTVPPKVPPIEPSLIATSMDTRGTRNTLAYQFGEMIVAAQEWFGPRNTSMLFLGFEFIPDHARVRYVTDYSAVIQLSFKGLRNPMSAYFELAHECVHLLSPEPYRSAKIIEEGMASLFGDIYMRDRFGLQVAPIPHPAYDEAKALVRILLAGDHFGIRAMREHMPNLRTLTPNILMDFFPTLEPQIANRLCRTFLSGTHDQNDTILQYLTEET